ncbi:MAG: LysE family transporter [Bacteroidia bacterium]
MLTSLLILLAASAVSCVGSLQLGPVNLYVINTTLQHGKKPAFMVAIGGVLPEFIYCALAVYANEFLLQNTTVNYIFNLLFIVLMWCIGAVLWFKKHTPVVIQHNVEISNTTAFSYVFKGVSLAMLNPQLLPFWIMVQVYFNSTHLLQLQTEAHKLAYIVGAGLGALLLLISLIGVVTKYKKNVVSLMNNRWYYKVLAVLFIAIAIQQLVTLINK